MNEQPRHEMLLETTHSSGEEEWVCPTCGRRLMITWRPWKKIILESGDMYAVHDGSKGVLKIGPLQINQGSDGRLLSGTDEDPYLDPWVKWLEKRDWDDL